MDGLLLLAGFAGWVWVRFRARPRPATTGPNRVDVHVGRAVVLGIVGVALLAMASRCIVAGSIALAAALGWSLYVIGAMMVAVGTSTLEIVTALLALYALYVGVTVWLDPSGSPCGALPAQMLKTSGPPGAGRYRPAAPGAASRNTAA